MSLQVMTEVMKFEDAELQLRASDVLLCALQHDPTPLRTFLLKQQENTLFTLLIRALIDDAPGSDAGDAADRGGLQ
eukprot:scaffold368616_cov49-Prasinocladus_malaysianus.AAC.1